MLERAHKGTFHKMSPKHLNRYVQEFTRKKNFRESDILDQMNAPSSVSWVGLSPAGGSSGTTGSTAGRGRSGPARRSKARDKVSGVAPARSRFGSSIGGRIVVLRPGSYSLPSNGRSYSATAPTSGLRVDMTAGRMPEGGGRVNYWV